MTSLVIGASGQVGALLYAAGIQQELCVGTYCSHFRPGLCQLDLRDHAAVRDLVVELRPEVCYVPGALTFVDYAESHPNECREINVLGIENLAHAVRRTRGVLVFFSTEHVFGDSPHPRREDEPVEPLSVYARSKAQAEEVIRDLLPDRHLILRTSWVFGPDAQRKNFFWRVCQTLGNGEKQVVPADQFGQPTYGPDLANTARTLVARSATGTFHAVGPQSLSRHGWALAIAKTLRLPQHLIVGTTTNGPQPAAPRPLRVQLDRRKLLNFLGTDPIRSPEEGVLQERLRWQRERLLLAS